MIVAGLLTVLSAPFVWALAYAVRALWGQPEEGGSAWESALAPELAQLTASPVEVIRVEPRAVEHVGASEAAPAAGAIGTLAERPSDDLLTFEQQVTGEPDEWAWFQKAMVAYEDALLTRREWIGIDEELNPFVLARESTQQRIDRWLSEGGDGVRAARADARMAVSDTWDAPSQELPLLHQYASDRLAEALLAS